jgi:hypothetical protein
VPQSKSHVLMYFNIAAGCCLIARRACSKQKAEDYR